MSKTCPNCGNIFEDEANICPRCGMQYIEAQPVNNGNTYQDYNNSGIYGQQYNQQPYGQYQQYGVPVQSSDSMTLGSWVGTILVTNLFGLISIILLFVWGFSDSTPIAKKNYCRAMLIYQAIMIGIAIIMMIFIFSVGFSLSDFMNYYSY